VTEEVKNILKSILGMEDPVSISAEERKVKTRMVDFFSAEENQLMEAFAAIHSEFKAPHTDDLFAFLITIRRYSEAYQKSGELWNSFGDYDQPQLVNIQMDSERHTGSLVIARFTREKLVELSKDTRQKMWAEFYLPRLDSLEGKIMILLFTDDEKSRVFGFPFDVMLTSEPNEKPR